MNSKILELINEQTSPLFRIMSIYNDNDSLRRIFQNNISASHIGNGFVLSVAHNLRSESGIIYSIYESDFQSNIFSRCTQPEKQLLTKCYIHDIQTSKRYLTISDNSDVQSLINLFKRINYDTRWITLYSQNICKPFLIIQFKNNTFYNDNSLAILINAAHKFPEPSLNTNTFLLELSLVQAFYQEDIALYKIVNADQKVISKIPYSSLNFDQCNTGEIINCLQSSPSGTNLGHLFNESRIEGLMEQHTIFVDNFAGNYFFEGLRYLLKGYFRFGSSGAPYFIYNKENNSFEINALQSEACPIQLSINNNREGNFQYVNAIATPLKIVQDKLLKEINSSRLTCSVPPVMDYAVRNESLIRNRLTLI